jgi:aminoglycoside/choline kinase family phosphotransferase
MQNQQNFSHWIECSLPAYVSVSNPLQLDALAGDAGFRRYYRLNTHPSLIAVNSPPLKEKNPAYVKLSLFLQSHGIKTPKIHAVNFDQGFMLLEDFGERLFQYQLAHEEPTKLYDSAESVLLEIQGCVADQRILPAYDQCKLGEELALFEQWFVNKLLGISLEANEKALLQQLYTDLIDNALQQPQVTVHTDYHSRNLMLLDNGNLGVIDFQDAMCGPITYDLVSLLKDCYVRWPEAWVKKRALDFKRRLEQSGSLSATDDCQFMRWFDLMGLQRHIKVLGIFARLALRDNKNAYLQDIPLVVRYSVEVISSYSETAAFSDWFKHRILPLLNNQSWYTEHVGGEK